MRLHLRRLVIACAIAACGMSVTAAGADALVVSPVGAYVANGSGETFGLPVSGQTIRCSASTKSMHVTGTGAGIVPAGGITASSCTNPLLGTVVLVASANWSLQVEQLHPSGAAIRFTLPARALTVSSTGCTFTLTGWFVKLTAAFTLSIPAGAPMPVTSSALRVDSNNGGMLCPLLAPVGTTIPYTGSLALTTTMNL